MIGSFDWIWPNSPADRVVQGGGFVRDLRDDTAMRADMLLTGGAIYTMDPERPRASSLAINQGRIVAVDEAVDALTTVNLAGRVVIPGFQDAHNHMAMHGIRLGEVDVSFPTVSNLDQLYAAVERAVGGVAPGTLVVAAGYDQNKLGGEHPDRSVLDAIAPNHPVWLKHTSGHMAMVNGATLALIDVNRCPPGGVVVIDGSGVPTGLLQEQAQSLVQDLVRPYSQDTLVDAVALASQQYASEGLTGVTEAGIGAGWVGNSPVEAAAYQACLDQGRLLQRVTLMPVSDAFHDVARGGDGDAYAIDLGLRTGFGNDRLRLGAMKVFSDGSLIGRTAAMCCAFDGGDPDNVGFLQEDVETLRHKIRGAHRAGWQVAVHAIGDRAVATTIDIFAEVLAEMPRDDHRHRIEHCGVCQPGDVARMAELGLVAVPQGRFIAEIGDGMMAALGSARTEWCYRGQSFLDAGVALAGSSDRPVVLGAPLLGIEALVTRRTASGVELAPAEKLSVGDAIRSYTMGSTFANFSDRDCGSLEPGKFADLVVLDADPFTVDPDTIGQIGVLATAVAGELTHGEW